MARVRNSGASALARERGVGLAGVKSNREIAAVFRRLADLLEIRGDPVYKTAAYRRAAESVAQLGGSVTEARQRGELQRIPGVGKAIAQKIEDLLDTGTFKLLDEVQAELPAGLAEVLAVPEVGPKRARLLYERLGVDSLAALRAATLEGRLQGVPGLGPRGAQRIAEGLGALPVPEERRPLGAARAAGLRLVEELLATGLADRVELAGCARRYRETVEGLDLVAAARRPAALLEAFAALPAVASLEATAEHARAGTLQDGTSVELRAVHPDRWGALLLTRTGSAAHVERLRTLATEQGLTLDELGLWAGAPPELAPCAMEEQVYGRLGLRPVPPPMREGWGEVELALRGELPPAFEAERLRGDLHTHSTWSDGKRSILEMAEAARARGYEYLGVSDHSQSLGVANGLSPERLEAQRAEIEAVNAQLAPFRVLQGCEVEVRGDGSLDLPDEVLARLDLVTASVHSGLRQGRERVTARALAALRHPLVDVLAHPTGRLVGGRPGGDFDMEALLAEAARTGTALEINGDPARLDLRDTHARAAAEAGCALTIGSDAHSSEGLENVRYGAAVATRARLEPGRVLNTLPLPELMGRLKRHRS
jgi:DNA polymerase (family 10)